jgi:hypothetical protein
MIEICRIVDNSDRIPVDDWDEETPISAQDRIFRNIKGEIIIPLAEYFHNNGKDMEEHQALDYFYMSTKRSYNSDETRKHICKYLNYFEKYYDKDKELLVVINKIKIQIDFFRDYSIDNFMDDVNRFIIRHNSLSWKIRHFVDDNYSMNLSNNNNRTPNLQFNNEHAKVLYEISLLMNIYIPLATHYMYVHLIKESADIQRFMLKLFDMCMVKYEEERGIHVFNKLYETALSIVNKSKNPDKQLWEKNQIRGNNTTTHTRDSVVDIILQIMPKYTYNASIINFNYFSGRQFLKYKITDIAYECSLSKLSSSKRDEDQNSEYDRYEARLNKKDEALLLQNKVAAEMAVKKVEEFWGPFTDAEIEHYRKRLTKDGSPAINPFQQQFVKYLYDKDFGDPITLNAIKNQTDYIKLIIAGKRYFIQTGRVSLAYILSSRVIRTPSRKILSRKDVMRIENNDLYAQIKHKYNNENVEQKIWEFIGVVMSSQFEIIDFDPEKGCPTKIDGETLPIINDLVNEDLQKFIAEI